MISDLCPITNVAAEEKQALEADMLHVRVHLSPFGLLSEKKYRSCLGEGYQMNI